MKTFKYLSLTYLLFYLIVFTGFRYQIANPEIAQVNIIVLLSIVAIWIAYWLITDSGIAVPPYNAIFAGYFLLFITFVFHSVDPVLSLGELSMLMVAGIIFYGIINLIKAGVERDTLINSLLGVGAVYGIVKIFQIVQHWDPLACSKYGVLTPNNTAGFVSMTAVLALGSMLYLRNRPVIRGWGRGKMILPGFVFITSAIILFFTGSRGGAVAGVAGASIVLLVDAFYRETLTWKTAVVALVLSVVFVGSSALVNRPLYCANGVVSTAWTTSITTRGELWETAVDIFIEYPILGSGPGTFSYLAGPLFDYARSSVHPHNIYLSLLAERGIIGALYACVVLMTVMKVIVMDQDNIHLKAIGLGVLIVFLVQGLVDVITYEPYITRMMYAVMAIVLSPKGRERTNAENDQFRCRYHD